MKKKVLVSLGIVLFLGLIFVLVLRFLALSNALPSSPVISQLQNIPIVNKLTADTSIRGQASTNIDGVTYEVINKIPDYQITSQEIDAKQLQTYLHNLDLLPLNNKKFIEYSFTKEGTANQKIKAADYKKIRVTFLPASQLPADYSNSQTFHGVHFLDQVADGRLANSFFAGTANGDIFDISVYMDPIAVNQFQLNTSQYLTSSFLQTLFINFNDQTYKDTSNPDMDYGNKIKDLSIPIFQASKKTSLLPTVSLEALKDLLIPQAYAGCGSVTCGISIQPKTGKCSGVTTTTHRCSGGTNPDCSSTPCDVYSGTCIANTTTSGGGGSCYTDAGCSGAGSCVGAQPNYSCTGVGPGACQQSYNNAVLSCNHSCQDCAIGSCGSPTCTWGAFSACTNANTCGVAGTKTRTSDCGGTDTQPCAIVACCGNGSCAGGETCSSCASDCGSCTPTGQYCGDGACNNGESCGTCAKDCGVCPPTCTPSCATSCGQSDGCTGTCSNADAGAPATPTGLNPANGNAIVSGNGQVTLSWNPVAKADLYEIQVYPTGTAVGKECDVTTLNHHCPGPFASNNYTFAVDSGVTSYTWRVRAINTTCGASAYSPWTTPITFTFGGGFSGSFYQDDSGIAGRVGNAMCQGVGTPLVNAPAGSGVNAIWNGPPGTNGTVNGTSYSISSIGANPNTIVTLSLPAGYRCTCPTGCSYSGISVPKGGVDFYITSAQAGWWQSSNGYVYAGANSGPAITSQIPLTCAAAPASCTAALSTYDSKKTAGSDATSLTGGGVIDSTADVTTTYSYLNQSGTNTHAEGMALNGPREDYNYFAQLYGITSSTTPDFTGAQPASDVTHGYYANGDVTISTPWTLNTTDSIVVFVNGDLTISQPIQVAKGAFAAFIVKGNITFDKSLGDNTSNAPSVAGVYIADGQIITQTNSPGDDLKFIGEGTFVGWTGVQLQRTFNNANVVKGNTQAIETFNFRPDFLVTVPEKMTKPLFLWQETN